MPTNLPNGTLISTKELELPSAAVRQIRRSCTEKEAEQLVRSRFYAITYASDGLEICGYLAIPPVDALSLNEEGKFPALIFNRGGAGVRGAMTPETAFAVFGAFVAYGYVVIASNYRGQGGSEGNEEWGAGDVDDALNILPLLQSQPYVDMDRIGLVAGSRGGMMAFQMLTKTNIFRAAVTFGAPTSFLNITNSEYIKKLMLSYVPNGSDPLEEARKRSAVAFVDKFCKTTPLLILHGTGDKRVAPEHSLSLALELQKIHFPYKLIMYDNADHVLAGRREESNIDIRWWIDKYVKNRAPLPKIGPHGA